MVTNIWITFGLEYFFENFILGLLLHKAQRPFPADTVWYRSELQLAASYFEIEDIPMPLITFMMIMETPEAMNEVTNVTSITI